MSTEPKKEHEEESEEPESFAEEMDRENTEADAEPAAESGGQEARADNEVIALQEEVARMKDQALRALAEVENTRRRARKEREDASKFAISGFAKDLLDVADNLRRAIESFPEEAREDVKITNFLEGIEATEKELLKAFEKHGIQKLEPMDEIFDPNFHEVMFETPGTGKPPGTIVQLIEAGYTLNDRILRPARVGVAKDEGQGDNSTQDNNEPGSNIDTSA